MGVCFLQLFDPMQCVVSKSDIWLFYACIFQDCCPLKSKYLTKIYEVITLSRFFKKIMLNLSSKIEILKRKVCYKSCNWIKFCPLWEFKVSKESGDNCSTPNMAQSTNPHFFPFKPILSTSLWSYLGWGKHY